MNTCNVCKFEFWNRYFILLWKLIVQECRLAHLSSVAMLWHNSFPLQNKKFLQPRPSLSIFVFTAEYVTYSAGVYLWRTDKCGSNFMGRLGYCQRAFVCSVSRWRRALRVSFSYSRVYNSHCTRLQVSASTNKTITYPIRSCNEDILD